MSRLVYCGAIVLVLLTGALTASWQHKNIAELRAAAAAAHEAASAPAPEFKDGREKADSSPSAPPGELMRLRGEVTLLHRELAERPEIVSSKQMAEEWAYVYKGPKPSDHPGFAFFSNLTNVGFATPEAAFQSFNYSMRNQHKEPLDNTRMAALWDVPDDYDAPDSRYSISLGEGMGSEIGYRVINLERFATNQVKLTVDYERPDGSFFRRQKVMVEHNGHWRMKPESVIRAP